MLHKHPNVAVPQGVFILFHEPEYLKIFPNAYSVGGRDTGGPRKGKDKGAILVVLNSLLSTFKSRIHVAIFPLKE